MSRKASRNKPRNRSRDKSQINRLSPLAGVLAAGLSLPLLAGAQSKQPGTRRRGLGRLSAECNASASGMLAPATISEQR